MHTRRSLRVLAALAVVGVSVLGGATGGSAGAADGQGGAASSKAGAASGSAPVFVSAASTSFLAGQDNVFYFQANGDPAPTVALSGTLPTGVAFSTSTDLLTGTPGPGAGGKYTLTATATNGVAPTATQSFALEVDENPTVTSVSALSAVVGHSVTWSATATGYPSPVLAINGTLPAGMGTSNGMLSGTPAAGTAGTYPLTVTAGATAADGTPLSTFGKLTLTVAATPSAPVFTSGTTTTFTQGTAGVFVVAATGAPSPSFSETGTLPGGVTLTPTGILGGTPTTSGTYPITLVAANGTLPNANQSFVLVVNAPPTITSAATTTFTHDVAGSFHITTAGFPTPTVAVAGTLPGGVTFNPVTNVLSGTAPASAVGTYPLTVTASNGSGANATQTLNVVVGGPPSITSGTSVVFHINVTGLFSVTGTGSPAPTFSEKGALPKGVTFSGDGTLTGAPDPASGGAYPIVFTASNGTFPDATQNFVLTVDQPPAFTSVQSAVFTKGVAGSFTFTTTGFPAPTLVLSGALPSGVTFNPATNVLSGAAPVSAAGSWPVTVDASNGLGADVSQNFTLIVGTPPAITSNTSAIFTVGVVGSFAVTGTGFPSPTFSTKSTLPPGLTLSSAGVLSGTPAAGSGKVYPITLAATNGTAPDASQSFSLTVYQATAVSSPATAMLVEGAAGAFHVTSSGFPVAAESVTGTLPNGVSFDPSTDLLGGVPQIGSHGIYPLTVSSDNGLGNIATQTLTLTVGVAPTITSSATATFTIGTAGSYTLTATGYPTPTFSTSGLPSGLSLSPSGVLSGTPGAGSGRVYALTITASNGASPAAAQSFGLTVYGAPAPTATGSTWFTEGVAKTYALSVPAWPAPTVTETGPLPPGITFDPAALTLTGTPAIGTHGNYPISFSAVNGVGSPAGQKFTLSVGSVPYFTTGSSATFKVGTAGSFHVGATGYPNPTLSETGKLPGGVTFTSAGVLSGTPVVGSGAAYTITITATNGTAATGIQSFTLIVDEAPGLPAFNQIFWPQTWPKYAQFKPIGYPAPTMSVSANMPSWAVLDSSSDTLTATAPAGSQGEYVMTMTFTNALGTVTGPLFFESVLAPDITSDPFTTFLVGTHGSYTVVGTGFPAPTFSVTGKLPPGVSLNPTTGVLSGTPAAGSGGLYTFVVTGDNHSHYNIYQPFLLEVDEGAGFTTSTLPELTEGVASSGTVTASGWPAPTLTAGGVLPSGVSFAVTPGDPLGGTLPGGAPTTGALTGTPGPGSHGSYPVTLSVTNDYGTKTVNDNLVVGTEPVFTSSTSATFTSGTPGMVNVAATGYPTPKLSETGALPSGVTFDPSTGTLSGTPAPGSGKVYPITFTANNGTATNPTLSFSLTINDAPLFTSPTTTTLTEGTPAAFTPALTGYPVPVVTETGALPTGVTVDPATGALGGAPTFGSHGTYPITYSAHNGIGVDATQSFTLVVGVTPAFTSPPTGTLTLGQAGTVTVTATGDPPPTFSVNGALPTGVTFSSSGVFSGTPTVGAGRIYPLTITATNGTAGVITQSFTLTVQGAPTFTSANTATFTAGLSGSFSVTTPAFPVAAVVETGGLPSGVTFDPTTGLLAGSPLASAAGTYPITFSAHNSLGDASQNFTLVVGTPASITSAATATFTATKAGLFAMSASGSPRAVWSEAGALPSGVTLSPSGVLSGTPAAGSTKSWPITVSANNGTSPVATQSFTLVVTTAPPPPPPPVSTGYLLVGADGGIFAFGGAPFYGSTGDIHLVRPVVGITPTLHHHGYWMVASDGGVFALGDAGFVGSIPGLGIGPVGSSGGGTKLAAPVVALAGTRDGGGYWMLGSDGGVFAFGDAGFVGSCPAVPGGCAGTAVALIPDATGRGYWVVTSIGAVYAFGDASYLGGAATQGSPVTAATSTPDGGGYWVLTANGTVNAFGDAPRLGGVTVPSGVTAAGLAAGATGKGYWVAESNGTVTAFGDAVNAGGMTKLNSPIIAAVGFGPVG